MTRDTRFDDIRPYYDEEIPAAMERIVSNDSFRTVADYIFPGKPFDAVCNRLRSISNIIEFQHVVMADVVEMVIRRSISAFTFSGTELLEKGRNYLFVSNHRDIVLDAMLLQWVLYNVNMNTSEITFGANLMNGQFIIDLGKSNKMFRVERPGLSVFSSREFLESSKHLSDYIRYDITSKGESVWIAQRNGRTKNGFDSTDPGIIKMFLMSGQDNQVESLSELNIVPLAISYEWEPCDFLKVIELCKTAHGPYTKKSGEDLNSILTGITQPKGRVHLAFCKPLTLEDLNPSGELKTNKFCKEAAALIDRRIHQAYSLSPNNWIAYDILHGQEANATRYTEEEKAAFTARMDQLKKHADLNQDELKEIFLEIYSNPVENHLNDGFTST